MEDALIRGLLAQGGFAVLAGVLIFIGWRTMQSAEKLLLRILDQLPQVASSQATLSASVDGLRAEVAGLRSIMHNVANYQAEFERRLWQVEHEGKHHPPPAPPAPKRREP